ncbi:MAG: S8 family serine peptidase, partial [Gammaproteobacteria bacterium]|nr:S8 family serine peptidase [Gammaproteobacteria bacterium]NIW97010.1 S8 family serine peptidase [Phycisphaerae bacterium]
MANPNPPTYDKNWDYGAVRDAVADAIAQNVVVVAAAGNQAQSSTFSTPCDEIPYTAWPANYPGVIGVSGSEQSGDFVDGW